MNSLYGIDGQFVIWVAIGILVLLGIMVINNKMRRVAMFCARAVIGIAGIAAINFALSGFGLTAAVGINILTMAVAAFLGIPGIVMLYGLTFIL